jgi:hypothetical protein
MLATRYQHRIGILEGHHCAILSRLELIVYTNSYLYSILLTSQKGEDSIPPLHRPY